jgi:adenylosuccinate synthase
LPAAPCSQEPIPRRCLPDWAIRHESIHFCCTHSVDVDGELAKLGDRVDYVVRYQGGNNAGHTVVIGEESYALHMLPSGVLSPRVVPGIGNGVVMDPQVLVDEIDGLTDRGIDCGKLLVSANAHLITPYHRALD